jgi:hypothetical protein
VYRFLGIFWFSAGMILLALPRLYPSLRDDPRMANSVSMAVFCFAVSSYNMIRWWLTFVRDRKNEAEYQEFLRRHDEHKPIDPTFDLGDQKPSDGIKEKPD